MSKFCPNKNTAAFKTMEAALGDSIATSVWYENGGEPIWNNPDGSPSTLWNSLVTHPEIASDAHAMSIKAHMYTKAFRNKFQNQSVEPTVKELSDYINNRTALQATMNMYKELDLLDKKDSTKPKKWLKTDANYKKVLKLSQDVNRGDVARAKVIELGVGSKNYYTLSLSPKNAFTTTEGVVTASFDPKTGAINFSEKGLTEETVIHEFAHPFVDALQKNNPELFNNMLSSIRKDAKKSSEVASILEHVKKNYGSLTTNIAKKEILAYTLSEYGKGNINPETGTNTKGAIERFYEWLSSLANDIIYAIKNGKNIHVEQIHPKTPYKVVADIFTVGAEELSIGLDALDGPVRESIDYLTPKKRKVTSGTQTELFTSDRVEYGAELKTEGNKVVTDKTDRAGSKYTKFFVSQDGNTAEFEFFNRKRGVVDGVARYNGEEALNFPDLYLNKAAYVATETLDKNANQIYTTKRGKAVKKDGRWVVTERAEVQTTEPTTETTAKPLSALQKKMAARKANKNTNTGEAYKVLSTKPSEFVSLKDEAKHMSSLLPKEIVTKLHDGYVKVLSGGLPVMGMFKDSIIHLSKTGPKGTAFHEGFHAVFRTILNETEQAQILAEAKQVYLKPTAKELLDLKLRHNVTEEVAEEIFYEEALADDFSLYMENPRAEYSTGIKGLFEKLAAWIKNVFSKRGTVDKLFTNISTGKYKTVKPNIVRGVAYKVHPTFDITEVNKITRELASIAFVDVNNATDLRANKITLETIGDAIADSAIAAEEAGNTDLIERLEQLFDENTGEIEVFWLKEVDSYLRNSLGLKKVRNGRKKLTAEKITEEDVEEMNEEDREKSTFLKSSYEVSGKLNATAAIKFMVAMTPKMNIIDKSKPATLDNMTQTLSPLTGLPVLVDFGMFYNDVENILSNIVSTKNEDGTTHDPLRTMLTELKKQAKYKPEMLLLANKIETSESEQLRTQFYNAFSKHKGSFVHHQIAGKKKQKNLLSKISTSNFSTKSAVILDSWIYNFAEKMTVLDPVSKDKVYSEQKIIDFFVSKDALRNEIDLYEELSESGEKFDPTQLNAAFAQTLNTLGVNLNPNTINYIVEDRIDMDEDLSYAEKYAAEILNLYSEFDKATAELADRKGNIFNNNHLSNERSFFKNTLAEYESYFKHIPGESAFVGPDGNMIYSYQNFDLTSKTVNKIKQGDLSHLTNVKKSAYGKHSVWATEMLDGVNGQANREDFGLHMYGNLKSEETAGDKGAKASELKEIDTYMDVVNKQLNGYYIGLAEADKSRQTYFKGPKLRNSGFTAKEMNNTDGKFVMSPKADGLRILKGYLADELSRMSIAHDVVYGTQSAEAVPEEKWILNYHYYNAPKGYTGETIGKNNDKIKGNAFYSLLFPNLNLQELGLQTQDGVMLSRNETNFWNNKNIDQALMKDFAELVKDELAYATKVGLIATEETSDKTKTKYVNKLISSNVVNTAQYKQGAEIDIVRVIADYTLNSIIGNVEQTKLFNMDPAGYKIKGVGIAPWNTIDHFSDFTKRIPASAASGLDYRIYDNADGTPGVRPAYTSATIANIETPSAFFGERTEDGDVRFNEDNLKEVSKVTGLEVTKLKNLFAPYLEINQTDAQAWITLDTYKERLNGVGQWTDAHEAAYNKMINGEQLPATEIALFAQPLKTVHAEPYMTENNEMLMQYNKQSEAVLLPFMADLELGKIMTAMENQGLDHVIVLDGKKAGASGIIDVTDGQGNILASKDIKFNPVSLSYDYLFLQQDLPTKQVGDKLVGSQMTKNVLSVVNPEGKYFNDTKTGEEVIALHNEVIGRLSDQGSVELDKAVGYNKKDRAFDFEIDKNAPSKLHNTLINEFEGEISEDHVQALSEKVPFDGLPIKTKIQNKLLSVTNKKTVKLKQSGAALIQMADLGFIGSKVKLTDKVKDGIIWFKDPTTRLEPMNIKEGKVNPAQILMPHSKIVEMLAGNSKAAIAAQDMLEEKYKTRNFKDLTHEQLSTLIETEALEGLSYRIPNQGPSSNDAFIIAGILPAEMGDTMVAFSDVTTKTGSDFDIDKAFVMVPNFYYDQEAGMIKKVGYEIDDLAGTSKAGLQNLRLDLAREMLLHKDAYASVMAPLDDPWLENMAKDLFPAERSTKNLSFFTGRTQMLNKATFDNAKSLVGTIANHMTSHALFTAEQISFKDVNLGLGNLTEEGWTNLSAKFDVEGNEIAATLGAFMNAIVDAAKDPYISRANINQTTAGVAFMLVRAGVPRDWVVSFIGQPIIKDLIAAQNGKEGRFGEETYSAQLQKVLSPVELVLKKYTNVESLEAEFRTQIKDGETVTNITKLTAQDLQKLIKGEVTSSKYTAKGSLAKSMDAADQKKFQELGRKREQLDILGTFLHFQNQAKGLNEVIRVSKADVNGAGKNLISAHMSKNLLDKVLLSDTFTGLNNYFGISEDGTYISGKDSKMLGRYFENSVENVLEKYSRFFISGSAASIELTSKVIKSAGREFVTNPDVESLAFKVSNEIYAAVASETDVFNLDPTELKELLYGSKTKKSISARVQKAKNTIKDNLLIDGLQIRAGRFGAPDKVMLPNTETVKETKESLFNAWSDLLASEDVATQELGKDLILYSFFTTGYSKGVGSFAEHTPQGWLKEQGFNEQINGKNQELQDNIFALTEKQDAIFKNLYRNNQLVPVVSDQVSDVITMKDGTNLTVNKDDAFTIPESAAGNYAVNEGPNGMIFKDYVKRSEVIKGPFGEVIATEYKLYKLAGYTHNQDAVYIRTNTLGMSGQGNNIKEYIGDPNISLFEKNNVSLPKGIQNLVDELSKRSINPESTEITFDKNDQMGSVEDREVFCLMI